MIYLISAIVLLVGALALFLVKDLKKWRNGIPVDHGGKTVIKRLPFQLPAAICFCIYANNLAAIPIAYIMMNFFWWEFFDGIYNIARKKKWRFNGSFNDIGHTDAFTDKMLRKMKPLQQALLKWGLILISVFVYILLIR